MKSIITLPIKKFTGIFLFVLLTANVTFAQLPKGVRIGNLEVIVKKSEQDTVAEIIVDNPCPPCPSEDEVRPTPKLKPKNRYESSFFTGVSFMVADYGNDYYTALDGNSFCIDVGWLQRYQLTRWLALGSTLQYSTYNYRLKDIANDQIFYDEVVGNSSLDINDIHKQAYRSKNLAASAFTRIYFAGSGHGGLRKNDKGLYLDLGIQGDFALSKFYMVKTHSDNKKKYRDSYAFNSFAASGLVRVGWNWFAVVARYRFTDLFNKEALPKDIPPLMIGIQLF